MFRSLVLPPRAGSEEDEISDLLVRREVNGERPAERESDHMDPAVGAGQPYPGFPNRRVAILPTHRGEVGWPALVAWQAHAAHGVTETAEEFAEETHVTCSPRRAMNEKAGLAAFLTGEEEGVVRTASDRPGEVCPRRHARFFRWRIHGLEGMSLN